MGKIIGIDLGTTNSCVALIEGGDAIVIPNTEGGRTTPSIVAFTKKGERLVGQPAKNQAITNPDNTIRSVKRFMGRRYEEIQSALKYVSYDIEKTSSDGVAIKVRDKSYTPPEISASILQKMKQSAEDYLGEKVTDAVITVPAYFDDSQRQATKDAGRIAGLNVKRIVNEPTAAALAYGLDKKKNEKIAVYDLGGGTFDITILDLGDGVFEVKSTNGDTHLGGDDFDEELIQYLVAEFKKDQGIDLSLDKIALQRLKEESEKAKKELSTSQSVDINLPFITADDSGPKHMNIQITRSKFEQLISPLMEQTRQPCINALNDAGLTSSEINEVILVGGSTRIPCVQAIVKEIFNREAHKGVNPDEVVAMGAAIQGGILGGDVKDVLLLDVTPLSLGIETIGGVMTRLIDRNTTVPTKKSQIFSTAMDNQSAVSIKVYQGEREMAIHNKLIGNFELIGISSAPRGVPQIEVTFDIDANGIINVSAKDLGTSKEQNIRIESSSGLTEEEIQTRIKEAGEHEEEDKKIRQLVESKNKLDNLIYQVDKYLKDNKDKIPEEQLKQTELELENLRKVLNSDNVDAIEKAVNELMALQSKLYQPHSGKANPGAAEANAHDNAQDNAQESTEENSTSKSKTANDKSDISGASEEKIVDADYEVFDDQKK